MTTIALTVGDCAFPFECRELQGEERLGEPSRFDLVAFSTQAVAIDDVLTGVVTRFSAVATAGRNYRFAVGPKQVLGGGILS